jgi:hypothetical protein
MSELSLLMGAKRKLDFEPAKDSFSHLADVEPALSGVRCRG